MAVSKNVRSVIELFCNILGDNGVSDVRAETLRQGKFNREAITKLMWKVLYDVTCFLTNKSTIPEGKAEQIQFVKRKLQNWGYLSQAFAELPTSLDHGSREILLALGWVIHTQNFFQEIIHRHTSPLHQDILSFATQKTRVDGPRNPICLQEDLPSKDKLQRQLMLCGKLKLKLRRLNASEQELSKLCQSIQRSTVGVSVQPELNHLTPLEVYLLRYPHSLEKMLLVLEEDNAKLKRLMEWKDNEHIFWEWMDSVLTLHIQDQAQESSHDTQASLGEESVLLDIPVDISEQISTLRTSVRDFILGHEENIDFLEKLVDTKKMSPIELKLINNQVEKELFELAEKFSCYEKGKFDLPVRNGAKRKTAMDKTNSDLSHHLGDIHGHHRRQRYVPQTAQSVKAAKEVEVGAMVQVEISALEKEVTKLEHELRQAQINSLNKLQSIAEKDINSICILPRCFKQFLDT